MPRKTAVRSSFMPEMSKSNRNPATNFSRLGKSIGRIEDRVVISNRRRAEICAEPQKSWLRGSAQNRRVARTDPSTRTPTGSVAINASASVERTRHSKGCWVANAAGQAISATYLASVSTEDIVFKIETEASAKMELSAHRYMKLTSPHKVVRFHC